MFLAWNEILYDKKKYTLVIGVMFLIAYLVYFLTGLAYGLAMENRMAVDQWQADAIILNEDANGNLAMSTLTIDQAQEVNADETALLGQMSAIITKEDSDEKVTASFFGIDPDSFLTPEVVEGDLFAEEGEIIVDVSLKEEEGFEIGDAINVSGTDQTFTIVGFTEDQKFNVAPVIHLDLNDYYSLRYEGMPEENQNRVNAVVVRGVTQDLSDDFERVAISDFINDLPGYSAQVLTFGFMIGFLIIIAAVVIGIFIYVLTIQKQALFGVMKAQGISNTYISNSVVLQTIILAGIGIIAGLTLTVLTGYFLPSSVPFQSQFTFYGIISALILVCAIIGALFSVRTITQIDPAQAIA